jgi:hypothetical protein
MHWMLSAIEEISYYDLPLCHILIVMYALPQGG